MLLDLDLPASEFQSPVSSSAIPLGISEGIGMVVNELLSPSECRVIISQCDNAGWGSISKEYPESYRNNARLLFKCESLSNLLWERMAKMGVLDSFKGVRPFGFGNDGEWEVVGLNECFKACKYEQGGAFKPHFDGVFVRTDDERSAVTVMIYLNEEFEGGVTNFLAASDKELESYAHSDTSTDNKKVMKVLEPKTGLAVVFTHDVLHEGAPVTTGHKYILRTELMFKRVSGPPANYKIQPNYPQALRLYKLADMLEAEGDPYGSTICYLKALDLQKIHTSTSASLPSSPLSSASSDLSSLPHDVLYLIFSYFSPSLVLSFALVCKKWQQVTSEDWLWKRITEERWPLLCSLSSPPSPPSLRASKKKKDKKDNKDKKRDKDNNKDKNKDKDNKDKKQKGKKANTWRQCYVAQTSQNTPVIFLHTYTKTMAGFAGENTPRHFKVSCFTPGGLADSVHYNIAGRSARDMRCRMFVFHQDFSLTPGNITSQYWFRYIRNDNSLLSSEQAARVWSSLFMELISFDQTLIDDLSTKDDYDRLEEYIQRHSHPVLFVNYCLAPELLDLLRMVALEVLRAPAFCICSFGELVLFGLKVTSGFVVDFGFDQHPGERPTLPQNESNIFVEYVKNGKRSDVQKTKIAHEKILQMVAKLGNTEAAEALKNVVLVGTHPEEPETILKELQAKLPQFKSNVYLAPESETAIWKGASLFAFSTHTNPAFYSTKLPKQDYESGKWIDKETYMRGIPKYAGQERFLAAAKIELLKEKNQNCTLA